MAANTTFQQYLQNAFAKGLFSTDEVIAFVLPLFEEVLSFHENNQVGSFEKAETLFITNDRLDIDENFSHAPNINLQALQPLLEYQKIKGYSITERIKIDQDVTNSKTSVLNLQVQENPNEPLIQPVYLTGYQCYEIKAGHHDAQTDIFCLGLILGSMVTGLDLYDVEELNQFVAYRNQPAGLNPRMHPTVCGLVTEMTELDRKDRSRDLQEIVQRLKYYRDYDPQKQSDLSSLAAFQVKKPADRKSFILSKLRNRLFDTSRRNRLLYYKPNGRFVNLTVSSVPMVLHYQSINPQLLFTWNEEISRQIIGQKDISLNKYLRFEDHSYLNAQLNGIRQHAENDKKEFGFSQLKLVVAFLHWHNLKEEINERIQSPLLLLPVQLERKKSLKEERYTLKITDNAALINPILSNYLKDLYGILLPESIDFDEISMLQFFSLLEQKINDARQGVKLNYIDKPRIRIVHSIARQTINSYRRKLKLKAGPAFHQVEYNYSQDNYKPLGLELFRQKVEPKQSTLEFLVGEEFRPGSSKHLTDQADTVIKDTFHLTDGENNPYSWDFDICNIVLGNFNYKKMSLVSDYNKVAEERIEHPVFDELFSNEPRQAGFIQTENDPSQWYHVITADPTQARAVLHSRSGRSYIIQGPPGTGKSQTITNLIADFLARGKTILFVCEKRAALDVVYHRLQQNQLAELCCYIHDSQGDKKDFIRNLKTIYDEFLNNKLDIQAITTQREFILKQLLDRIKYLQLYHQQQQAINPEAGLNTRKLIERLVSINITIPESNPVTEEKIPGYSDWLQYGEVIQDLSKALADSGADEQLANHPFNNLGTEVIQAENPFTLLNSLVSLSQTAIQQINEIVSKNNIPAIHSRQLESLKNLIQDSVILEPLARTNNLRLVNESNTEAREFEQSYRQYKEIQRSYQQALESNKRWLHKFEKAEVEQSLTVAEKHERSFLGFLNGSWRRLKRQLKESYDFSAHQVKPLYSMVLKQLQEEYHIGEKASQVKDELEKSYHVSGIDTVYVGIEVLRRKQGDKEIDFLLAHPEANQLVLQLSKLNNVLHQLELQLKQCLYKYDNKELGQLNDDLASIKSNEEALRDLLPGLRRFAQLPGALQQLIREMPLTPVQAEALMATKTLKHIYNNNRAFAVVTQRDIENTVKDIEKYYKELLQLNSDYIRAQRREQFTKRVEISNTSVTVLTPENKLLKKEYTEGRRILEHEMGKTMRYKSIREMASHESGKVLKDIKPVWLMSPLSVSDSLPLDTGFFDVVIFDEASQITLEEGVPALFRAPQTIIVGDDKQMPPSNFFTAKAEDPEDLETIDGENEEEILSADADSLLVQGSRKLNSTMLSWHYRSRYETLISYSNHAFYEAGLLTIPDRTIHHISKPLMVVQKPEEGTDNASVLLSGSISFHYMPDSVYEGRTNRGEAKYIACMVRKLLLENVQESIGIVAFSQEQQGVIEEAIDELAASDKTFEELLEKAFNRKDDGQFTGLFIKNLENVQGDERDIIIMSVCYGHDANKKMIMNFGPINRKGGEKRLNVIFSRAKKHMAVVSSIRHYDITNDYNDGANYFKRFLQYAEMVSTGNMAVARTILDGLVPAEQKISTIGDTISATARQIKTAMEQNGYLVDELIGQSGFKCNLGIKKTKDDTAYILGILIDDDNHYKNNDLVEQYYQRPSVLESFGWKIEKVFAKDWLEDKNRIVNLLLNKIEGVNGFPENEIKSETAVTNAAPAVENGGPVYSIYESSAAGKFWEIAQDDKQLFIRTGRTGTKGVVSIKTFTTGEEAATAKELLIEEQVRLGYLKRN